MKVSAMRPSRLVRLRDTLVQRGEYVRRHTGKGHVRQLLEMAWYHHRLGTSDEEYYGYRLYDPAVSLDEKSKFLSMKRWMDRSLVFNPRRERRAASDKVEFEQALSAAGVPVVGSLGRLDIRGLQPDRIAERIAAMVAGQENGFVVKPSEKGTEGRNVFVLTGRPTATGSLTRVNGEPWTLRALAEAMQAPCRDERFHKTFEFRHYIVQPRLPGHPQLARYGSATLSTVRVVTLLDPAGLFHVIAASFKLGVGDAGVDNFHAGNLAVPVDPVTGVLGTACQLGVDDVLTHHPVTGAPVAGERVPCWSEILEVAERAARALPGLRCLGWDVAVAAGGPIVIEANPLWAVDLIQAPQRRGVWRPPLTSTFEVLSSPMQRGAADGGRPVHDESRRP